MGKSHEKTILVEDIKAKVLLAELIRATKPSILKGVKITFVGNDDVVASLTMQFRQDKHVVIGVRDGDKGENVREFLFKLPGTKPPEQEVFSSAEVRALLNDKYYFDWGHWVALNSEMDFHDWPGAVAREVSKTEEGLWEELCCIYAHACERGQRDDLIRKIEM